MRLRRLAAALFVVLLAGGAILWLATRPVRALSDTDPRLAALHPDAQRGEIVFHAGGCAACHASPPPAGADKADYHRLGGGLHLKTAFGTFIVPNISPDAHDGIGAWTFVDFANALLSGVGPDGSHYYPVFPYTTYAHMRLQDVADLWAYLRTLPPVAGRQPPHELSFPWNQRWTLGIWQLLFLDRSPIRDDPARSASWNRGHYLVEALGHCAECHSPRNALGAVIKSERFAGGPNPEGKGFIPNITPAHLGKWTRSDFVDLLTTGDTPDYDSVGGSMVDVVQNTSALPKSDREAIADYLMSLKPLATPPHGK